MQPISVHWRPLFPDCGVLPERTIATARNVTKNAIEKKLVLSLVHYSCLRSRGKCDVLGRNLDSGEYGGIVIGDHQRRRRQPSRLVYQHVRALVIAVVSNEETRREGRGRGRVLRVECFQKLGGLRQSDQLFGQRKEVVL